ncbi:hypothetical protein BGZ95_009199 [Linnemannia exigua]|uniref:Uncharacterized protein n=1 Tax=Linnemannia exigua TaxID=604196 RepID=A0AAD4DD66_9FUNG|nr:hypothetical protein BGZ95_009199 [Linnemannia exigua]
MSDDNPWRNGTSRNNTDGGRGNGGRGWDGNGGGWNGTRGNGTYYDDGNHRAQHGWWNRERDGASIYADSMVTYVIATCYLSFLCFVALIMCFKNMTRLRVIAAMVTFLGLSIAVVGYLRANDDVLPNIYWAWNFFAEAVAVIALTIAIVSVGSGFYPMSGGRSIYARLSFVVICLYALISIGTFVVYVQQRVVKHAISPAEVQKLRVDIVNSGIFDQKDLNKTIRYSVRNGSIPNNTDIYGALDYTELSNPEQTFYMRPTLGMYLGHQICMMSACVWVCLYLFIPLVKHHRHGPAGRPVDSDMMAIGVWYLTCLISLAVAYAILNIVYCFNSELLYKPQIQALDLCLRITIGPIFFLPAPKMLIRFYRNHFKKFRGNSANKTSSNDRWGSRWRKNGLGGNGGDSGSSNTDSRTRYDSNNNNNAGDGSGGQNHHVLSRLDRGSGGGVDDAIAACAPFDAATGSHYRYDKDNKDSKSSSAKNGISNNMSTMMPTTTTPPPPTHKNLKLSRSRDRGLSVESSRVLTKDFDRRDSSLFYPSDQDTVNHNRPDSYYQPDYYSSGGMIMLDHRHNSSDSSSGSGSGSGSRENKRMTYGFNHPKPPKLALSPQQQQFLQSAPRSHMKRSDSSDSPSRLDFPPRSPIT